MKYDVENNDMVAGWFDDYGCGEGHAVSIGDEIISEVEDIQHGGVVVGIIQDNAGRHVCYKVWRIDDGAFDYVQASDVMMCEPCGSADWSLQRIGYERRPRAYVNRDIEDVILW